MLAVMLSMDTLDSQKGMNEREKRFRILYSWICKFPSVDHTQKLKEILEEAEEVAASESINTFCKSEFHYKDVVDPCKSVSSRDFEILSRNLSADYVHFARFLGVPQLEIEQIEETHCKITDRIIRIFDAIDQNPACTVNRQDLCNALVYIGKNNVVQQLMAVWKNP
jgi:hypothetical protein